MTARTVDIEQKRREIFEAAISLFSKKGIWSVTISEIAKEAGIGKGTVYEYYRTKEEIMMAAMRATMQELSDLYFEEYKKADNPMDKIMAYPHAIKRHFYEISRDSTRLIIVFQMDTFFNTDQKYDSIRKEIINVKTEITLPMVGAIYEAIDQGKEMGLIRKEIPNINIMFKMTHLGLGYIILLLTEENYATKYFDGLRELVFDGIANHNQGGKS